MAVKINYFEDLETGDDVEIEGLDLKSLKDIKVLERGHDFAPYLLCQVIFESKKGNVIIYHPCIELAIKEFSKKREKNLISIIQLEQAMKKLKIYGIRRDEDIMLENLEARLEVALESFLDIRREDSGDNFNEDKEIDNFKYELIHNFEEIDQAYELIDVNEEDEPEEYKIQKDFINKWARNDV